MLTRKLYSVFSTMRRLGPVAYSRYGWNRVLQFYHEGWLGLSTDGIVRLGELGLDESAGSEYGPTGYSCLYRILNRCSVRPDYDVFLDVGSGMGRVLVVAGRFPFRRIIGIDLSDELNRIAERNLELVRKKLRCKAVAIAVCDATTYAVPDDVTIVYSNYSFDGEVFLRFLGRVRESLERRPRSLQLVCNIPLLRETGIEQLVSQSGWLEKRDEMLLPAWSPQVRKCIFYQTL